MKSWAFRTLAVTVAFVLAAKLGDVENMIESAINDHCREYDHDHLNGFEDAVRDEVSGLLDSASISISV